MPSNNNNRSVSGSATRSVPDPTSGTRRANALRCAARNPADNSGSLSRTRAESSLDPRLIRDTRRPHRRGRTTRPRPRRARSARPAPTSAVLPIPASPATNTA